MIRAVGADHRLAWAAAGIAALGLFAPIAASLGTTLLAGFGHLPAIGARGLSFGPVQDLLATAGLATAVKLTLFTGITAAAMSLTLALSIAAAFGHSPRLSRALSPLLAIPHAALAVGLAFVLAPSGWIARTLAPLMGWQNPPDLATVGDPYGGALILGLVIKETPFLLLMIMAALRQIPLRQHMAAGLSLGYGRGAVWAKIIAPQLWPLIRLPFLVVLAYGLSGVEMAMILGPSNPPPLPVLLTRLYASPDPQALLPASAGAMLMLLVLALAFAICLMAERSLARLGRIWLRRGGRGAGLDAQLQGLAFGASALMALGALAMVSLAVWSLAWRWSWPDLWPSALSADAWGAANWGQPLINTLSIAVASTALSMILAIAWLEGADRAKTGRSPLPYGLIYLPLLLPQISFLFGLNILALKFGISGTALAVIWAHSLFVFPYVMIALWGPWRALDPRYDRSAQSLGAGPWRRLLRVKLPLLLAPLCAAAAIGVAVSVAQYLPTLFLGAGRMATLTTEAVTLASSSNRRVTAVVSSLQATLPLLAYLAAVLIPAYAHKDRRDLSGSTPE